jgi:hypothetical protein
LTCYYSLKASAYISQCYCGNTLAPGSVTAPETDCKYPCSGNVNEVCGGDNRLNVYRLGLSIPTSSSSSAATSPTSVPTTYTDNGCYTEATTGRALSSAAYYDDLMTVAKCSVACRGYSYFGVEYGREVSRRFAVLLVEPGLTKPTVLLWQHIQRGQCSNTKLRL